MTSKVSARRSVRVGNAVAGLLLIASTAGLGAAIAAEVETEESRSWGVAASSNYRVGNYHAPTPDVVPGARVISTVELRELLERGPRPYLIDVLGGAAHPTLPGSIWLRNGGLGDLDSAEEKRFLDALARIAGSDMTRTVVFFCSSARCWLSYNAALRAVRSGYTNVYWYRGGIEAWRAAGARTVTSDNFQW